MWRYGTKTPPNPAFKKPKIHAKLEINRLSDLINTQMKHFYLLAIALCCLSGVVQAQQRSTAPGIPPSHEPTPAANARMSAYVAPNHLPPAPLGGTCTGVDSLSSSSNLFTNILTEANPVAVDNATNSIIFIHRNNATAFGGHSGQLRYDLSTNGGTSWTSNAGPVNPLSVNGTNGARYPNVAIYNPAGNTDPNNAYLAYYAPTVAATFNGHVSGVRRLNGTGNTETYNQAGAAQPLIPRSLVKGAPGVFWSIDAVYNGTVTTGFRVLKGTWNAGSSDFVWAVNTTLTPAFNTAYDGTAHTSDFGIAFDPTGNIGWICFLGHLSGGPATYVYSPIFYQTTNGGTSWSGPTEVKVGQFPCIAGNITAPNTATTAFDMDLTVDAEGNPHCVTIAANGDNAYAVYFASWHTIVDINRDHGMWSADIIAPVFRGRGTWGTAPNAVSMDMECQIARSEDGNKLFYLWGDADSSNLNANQQPDLYGRSYNLLNRSFSPVKNFTGCHPIFGGRAIFPKAAETARTVTGGNQVAVVIGRLLGAAQDPIAVSSFHFVDSVYFYDNEYTLPKCTQVVSLAPGDTVTACSNTTLNAGAGQLYAWSTGATTQTISVNTPGWYKVTVSNNCCIGWDSVYVQIAVAPLAIFSTSGVGLTHNFTDLSTGIPTSWSWNFGDGNTSTLPSPTHTYAVPGTYNACLTVSNACSSGTACQSITVTCNPATPSFNFNANNLAVSFNNTTIGTLNSLLWNFGDGNASTLPNPTHTYTQPGTYTACLTITDSCGTDSTCQTITVSCAAPVAAFSSAPSALTVAFTDLSTGAPTSWWWSFGDGNLSVSQNPTHTYAIDGTYIVCLEVTDSCGTDSTCASVTVIGASAAAPHWGSVSLVPNPGSSQVRLVAEQLPAGEVQVSLHNVLGQRLLRTTQAHAGGVYTQALPVAPLERGLYFVTLELDGQRVTQKLIMR
jgi:PKD repeat protein